MIPRSPSPVQCVRIFAVLVLLAAAAGMTSGAGLSSSSTSSSSSPTQQVPTNGIPTIYMGMQKNPGTISPAPIVQPGACTTSSFAFPAGYTRYSDLAGNTNTLTGSTVAIGAKPLLLINQ